MRSTRKAAALAFFGGLAIACGTSATSPNASDGGNPSGCPGTRPTTGAPCTSSGLECSYGCNVSASCDGKTWTVSQLGISCPSDAGGGGDGPVRCQSNADCTSFLQCSPGGQPTGCGICAAPQNPCSVDSDCALIGDAAPSQPMVCGPPGECTCPVGGKTGSCIPACKTSSECGPDGACGPTGHCVAKPCSGDADCPPTSTAVYACSGGTCAIKPCKTDADCGANFCVNGACYPQPGLCTPPAA